MIDRRIPVYITTFNRLTTTRAMVEWVESTPFARPIIVDNGSTYKPLLRWYKKEPCEILRGPNKGPRSAWHYINRSVLWSSHYVVTDGDLDLSGCPTDMIGYLIDGLESNPEYCKCGPGLEIGDLPDGYPLKHEVIHEESKFWQKRVGPFFDAIIDTTFSVYKAHTPVCTYGPALRADYPYVARHVPWYIVPGTESKEEKYYHQFLQHEPGLRWSPALKRHLNVPKTPFPHGGSADLSAS